MQAETEAEHRMRRLREYCTQNQGKYNQILQTYQNSSVPRVINESNNQIIDIIMRGCNGLIQDALTICSLWAINPTVRNIVRHDLEFTQHDHISNSMLQSVMYSRESANEFYKILDGSASKSEMCQKMRDAGHLCNITDVQNMLMILAEKEFLGLPEKSAATAKELYQKWNVSNADCHDNTLTVFNSRCSVYRRASRTVVLSQFPCIIARIDAPSTHGQKRNGAVVTMQDHVITHAQYDILLQEIGDSKRRFTEAIDTQGQAVKLHDNLIDSIDQSGKITNDRVKKLSDRLERTMADMDSLYSKISTMKDQMLEMAHHNNILLRKITELENMQ